MSDARRGVLLEVVPGVTGRHFGVRIYHVALNGIEACAIDEPFLERSGLQGDMIQERLEDVINPAIRLMAKELDLELKRRRGQK